METVRLAVEMTGDPLVHTVPAGEQLPEPHLPEAFIAGAGHWSVGAGPGSASSAQGGSPTCASCGVAQPAHPPPRVLAPGTRTPHPCTRPPLSPGTGPPTEASSLGSSPVTRALLPEALGPSQGLPTSPERPLPRPPLWCSPHALAAGPWRRLQRGVGALRSLRPGCLLSIRTPWTERPWALSPQGRALRGPAQSPRPETEQPGWDSPHQRADSPHEADGDGEEGKWEHGLWSLDFSVCDLVPRR